MDERFKRGKVFFAYGDPDPGPDPVTGEERPPLEAKPWLIVSNNRRNRSFDTVLAVKITTTGKRSHLPTVVTIPHGEPVIGWVLCDSLTEIWEGLIDTNSHGQWREAGALSGQTMRLVGEGLMVALAIDPPPPTAE